MNNIDFFHPLESVVENFAPEPAKKVIPDWYKNIELLKNDVPTIKSCPPVQDLVTSGYILKSSFEYQVQVHVDGQNQEQFMAQCPMGLAAYSHQNDQFPLEKSNRKKSFLKIDTGWTIRTPKGYSCLLIQPFYFMEERFTLLPAIVDTDSFDSTVQFPVILNQDDVTIEPGTPLVQVIPFKREEWKSSSEQKQKSSLFDLFVPKPFANIYKKYCRHKKKFY